MIMDNYSPTPILTSFIQRELLLSIICQFCNLLKIKFKHNDVSKWMCSLEHMDSALKCLICLFVWGLSSHSRIFHSYGDVTITGEGLQILTYARHSWPLSSEGSLACHTYCDTDHPFIMVISKDP